MMGLKIALRPVFVVPADAVVTKPHHFICLEEETIKENHGYVEQLVEVDFNSSRRKGEVRTSGEDTGGS